MTAAEVIFKRVTKITFCSQIETFRISSLKIWSLSDYFNDDTEMTIEPEERLPHLYILVGFKFSQSVIFYYENVDLKILKS